jgi:hypothetical protein
VPETKSMADYEEARAVALSAREEADEIIKALGENREKALKTVMSVAQRFGEFRDTLSEITDDIGTVGELAEQLEAVADHAPGGAKYVDPFAALRHDLVDRAGQVLHVKAYPSGELELVAEDGRVVLELDVPAEG